MTVIDYRLIRKKTANTIRNVLFDTFIISKENTYILDIFYLILYAIKSQISHCKIFVFTFCRILQMSNVLFEVS